MEQFTLNCISERGRRAENEDSFWASTLVVDGRPCAVACVCDGMGGLTRGRYTSMRIAQEVRDYVLKNGTIAGIVDVLYNVSHSIYEESANRNATSAKQDGGSGTTCTLVFLSEGQWVMYHIGDSRLFHYDSTTNNIVQESYDHTAMNERREEYEACKNADPRTDPNAEEKHRKANWMEQAFKNKLTRCLGAMPNPQIDERRGTYHTGDKFMICSDGFWHNLDVVNDIHAQDFMQLVQKFLSMGEADNMTAVGITVEDFA